MTDIYVYHYTTSGEKPDESMRSTLRATLAAIKHIGEPLMESQIVVDHTEVDGDGFVSGAHGIGARPSNDRTGEIRSLQLRADSRDCEALAMNDTTEGRDKYMLQLESRELRNQAKKLGHARVAPAADGDADLDDPSFAQFGGAASAS